MSESDVSLIDVDHDEHRPLRAHRNPRQSDHTEHSYVSEESETSARATVSGYLYAANSWQVGTGVTVSSSSRLFPLDMVALHCSLTMAGQPALHFSAWRFSVQLQVSNALHRAFCRAREGL